MNTPICFRAPVALIALLPSMLVAASSPASTASKNDPVTLSPFVVTELTDTGYAATSSLDGSRLNTSLKDTPGAISVFTKDLLDDLSATSIEDILRYDVNADMTHGGDDPVGNGNQDNMFGDQGISFSVRGLPGTSSVDGFQNAGQPNTYNIQRVGSTRGPNAILFGTGSAGGNLNFRTRTALVNRDLTTLDFKIGTESTRRGALDANYVLRKDKIGLRLMGVWDRKGNPRPHQYTDIQAATLAAKYQIARDTSLTLSYERSHTEGVTGRNWNHIDNLTQFVTAVNDGQIRWNPTRERYENANGSNLSNATAGTGNVNHRNVLVYGPDLSVAPLFWEGARANANFTTFSTNSSLFNSNENLILSEAYEPYGSVTSSGAGEFAGVTTTNLTAVFNHRWFTSLFMELAYNKNTRRSDTTLGGNPSLRGDLDYRLPNGSLNPYFFGNGYYYSEQNALRLKRQNDNETLRAAFSYERDLGKWGFHRLAVMGERNVNTEQRLRTREAWAGSPYNNTPENGNNRVFRRRYIKIGGPHADYTSGFQPVNPFNIESYQSGIGSIGNLTTDWVAANDRDFDDEITTDSYMAVLQNYFFNRRLVTTLGVRDDNISIFGPRTIRDPETRIWRFATAADQPRFNLSKQQWYTTDETSGLRRSLGAVFHVTRNFSLTANYSNGVGLGERNRSALPNDLTPPPFKGTGYDYGITFSLLENRISGSLKRYESKVLGDRIQGGGAVFVNPNNDVMASFDYYYRQAGLTNLGSGAPISDLNDLTTKLQSSADSFLSDRDSTGVEFEVIANLTRNWTIRAAYSYTDRTRTNVLFEGVPWWAERVSLFESLDSYYTAQTGRPSVYRQLVYDIDQSVGDVTVAERIAQSATELATVRLEEEQAYGNRPHKANIWTRYSLSSGPLRGLAVGGGWRYQSANVAGVVLADRSTLWGNARSIGDLFLQYRTKGLAGYWKDSTQVTYQLNVTNFLDDRTINASKLDLDPVSKIVFPRRAFRENPRTVTFTLRLDF